MHCIDRGVLHFDRVRLSVMVRCCQGNSIMCNPCSPASSRILFLLIKNNMSSNRYLGCDRREEETRKKITQYRYEVSSRGTESNWSVSYGWKSRDFAPAQSLPTAIHEPAHFLHWQGEHQRRRIRKQYLIAPGKAEERPSLYSGGHSRRQAPLRQRRYRRASLTTPYGVLDHSPF
mgnify:CR=1 FL=1